MGLAVWMFLDVHGCGRGRGHEMRKDPVQDADRTHYYSQFWVDVVAGKPIGQGASAPAAAEEADIGDTDFEALLAEPPLPPMPAPPKVEKVEKVEKPKKSAEKKEPARSLSSLADLANIDLLMKNSAEMGDEAVPDIEAGAASPEPAPGVVTDFDVAQAGTEEPAMLVEDEDVFDEDEDADADDWGGGRKPKPKKAPRREKPRF